MNIIYEFTNLKLEVAPSLNGNAMVVTRVHYTYRATDIDSNIYVDYDSFHNFELIPESQFKPFEQLLPNDIKEWLEANVNTLVLHPGLSNKVEDLLTSKYVSVKAPWEPVDEVIKEP